MLIEEECEGCDDHVYGLRVALGSAVESGEIMSDLRVLGLDRVGVGF